MEVKNPRSRSAGCLPIFFKKNNTLSGVLRQRLQWVSRGTCLPEARCPKEERREPLSATAKRATAKRCEWPPNGRATAANGETVASSQPHQAGRAGNVNTERPRATSCHWCRRQTSDDDNQRPHRPIDTDRRVRRERGGRARQRRRADPRGSDTTTRHRERAHPPRRGRRPCLASCTRGT